MKGPIAALLIGVILFVTGIGWWAFTLTADLADLPAGGRGAVLAILGGAGLLILLFLSLRQWRVERDARSRQERTGKDDPARRHEGFTPSTTHRD
ncbi:MAG: hypothetical protein RLY86_4306 [Pseudomonadota bacterium]|jgi:uncharacterized protein (DUF58 family)